MGYLIAAAALSLSATGIAAAAPGVAAPAAAVAAVSWSEGGSAVAAQRAPAAESGREQPGRKAARRAAASGKSIIRGWNTSAAAVAPGAVISDRIAVLTGGSRLKRGIEVQRRQPETSGWIGVSRLRTDERGRATVQYTLPPEGRWWFRAAVLADAKGGQARSGKRAVDVVPPEPAGYPLPDLVPAAPPPPGTSGPAVAIVGDIGDCEGEPSVTAQLIDWIDGPLIVPGDVAYPDGSAQDFANCYDPFYGRFKERTFPVPGNHEYRTPEAAGYFDYFGTRAGTREDPWYSVDIAGWRFYMLNSNCDIVGCASGTVQHQWLSQQLAKPQPKCTAAVWHHPRWSSSNRGPDPVTQDLYQLLYDNGVDVLLSGHQHHYERFAPLSPLGGIDPLGVRNFTVGTGGQTLRGFGDIIQPGSEVRSRDSHGVLRMELGPTGYQWAFLPTEPLAETDPGWGQCR